jgi:hypothetical protein
MDAVTPVERLESLRKANLCAELYREGQRCQTAWAAIRRILVPPRHGRSIATFVGGSCVLLLFARALVDQRFDWLAPIPPVMQIEVVSAKRSLSVGDPVHAADGTLVGRVSGMSRDPHGHVERIRVTETTQMGSDRRILIIYDRYFLLGDGIVQLKLSVAELDAMPQAMTEDSAAGSGRPF